MDPSSNWQVDPNDMYGPYAPSCASRAAEGVYSGILLGAVWGLVGHGSSSAILPLSHTTRPRPQVTPSHGGVSVSSKISRAFRGEIEAFTKGITGYTRSSMTTAGVFGVFVGVFHAGTCVCEQERRKKDWINSGVGGLAAGAAVAMLSKHTRSPRIVGAHAIGGCVVTSAVSILSTSSGTEDGGL